MRIPLILCGLGLCVGLWTGTGCQPGSQDTQTETSEGSETSSCTPGSESCTCGAGASCEPGLLCASGYCILDDQATGSETSSPVTTTVGTTEATGMTETSSDPTASTMTETSGPPLDCDPEAGIVGAECGESAPYCSPRGKCVACDAIDCSEVSSTTPTCDAASGTCVECTADDIGACDGVTPICGDSVCVACTEHAQCPSGACQLESGACFEAVLHVDRGASCAGADGSPDLPFCEIKDAVAEVAQAEPTAIFVKGNTTPYTGQVLIPSGRTVAILREGTGIAKIEVDAIDAVQINDGATLYMHEMQVSKGDVAKGVFCTGATVWLDRTQIVDRKGLGVDTADCKLVMRRSRVYLNLAGGLKLSGGSTRVENSFIVTNGGSFAAIAGVVLSNGATFDAVYTTIADNDGKAGIEDSLDCTGAGEVKLRNSIVFGKTDATSVGCTGATASYSVVDSDMLTGEMNTVIKVLMQEWFIAPEQGNFGVLAGPPFEDVAVWKTGDPAVDFDDTARPNTDGAADYAGADRPN
jgi:hypothetical protein